MKDRAEEARRRASQITKKVTPKMSNYIAILLNDCGFGDRRNRNAYLSRIAARNIVFIDELTFDEGQHLIDNLEARRAEKDEPSEDESL